MLSKLKKYHKTLRRIFLNFISDVVDFFKIKIEYNQHKTFCTTIDNNTIVFVCDKFTPRVNKIIYGISTLKKYNVVLIHRKRNIFKEIDSKFINQTIFTKSNYKALWISKRINPFIIHIFSSWDFDIAYSIIKNKHKITSKIVFDDYDVFAGMLNPNLLETKLPGQLFKEKYCLENADGLCCRSLETQFAKRYLGYKYKGKRIFFPEYMWNEYRQNAKDENKKNVIVYAGNYNKFCVRVAEELKRINWQFDLFPAHSNTVLSSKPENLNLLKTISSDKLIDTLSRYRLAIVMPPEIAEGKDIYTENKRKYAMSGKIFDYMEANLKVLISGYDFLIFILKRYNSCIRLDEQNPVESLSEKINLIEWAESKSKNNFKRILLSENINRLITFYQSI